MTNAFISYASQNAARVTRLERALAASGHSVWRDRSKIRLGVLLRAQLQEAIRDCRTVVLVWSEGAEQSRWVAAEILMAYHVGRFIVPCTVDETPIPQFLAATVHLDLTRATKAALDMLSRAITEAPDGANTIPPAESSRSAEQRRAIETINRLQHEELEQLQQRALPAARRAHVTTERAMRHAEKTWRFDPLVLTLAGYHRKNAYMLKHWEALQAGRGPQDALLARAERYFFQTLFVDPTDPYGLDGLGSVLRLEREFDAAEFFFERAIEQASRRNLDYGEARQNLDSVRRARAGPGAGRVTPHPRALPPATARSGPHPPPLDALADDRQRAENALRGGQFEVAVAAFDRILAAAPRAAQAHVGRGEALLRLGRAADSLTAFESALAIQPGLVDARSARAALLVGFGRIDEGLQEIARVLAARPGDAQALYNKACAHSLRGEVETAIEALRQAIIAYPPYRGEAAADPHFAFVREDATCAQRFRALVGS